MPRCHPPSPTKLPSLTSHWLNYYRRRAAPLGSAHTLPWRPHQLEDQVAFWPAAHFQLLKELVAKIILSPWCVPDTSLSLLSEICRRETAMLSLTQDVCSKKKSPLIFFEKVGKSTPLLLELHNAPFNSTSKKRINVPAGFSPDALVLQLCRKHPTIYATR